MARKNSSAASIEAMALDDLEAFRDLAGLDGVSAAIVVLVVRSAALPRTVGARRPSKAMAFTRALAVLETATRTVRAMRIDEVTESRASTGGR
ncbi:MAG: hypothetical protein ACHREM_12605 [Polyangiales bacterium]